MSSIDVYYGAFCNSDCKFLELPEGVLHEWKCRWTPKCRKCGTRLDLMREYHKSDCTDYEKCVCGSRHPSGETFK